MEISRSLDSGGADDDEISANGGRISRNYWSFITRRGDGATEFSSWRTCGVYDDATLEDGDSDTSRGGDVARTKDATDAP